MIEDEFLDWLTQSYKHKAISKEALYHLRENPADHNWNDFWDWPSDERDALIARCIDSLIRTIEGKP